MAIPGGRMAIQMYQMRENYPKRAARSSSSTGVITPLFYLSVIINVLSLFGEFDKNFDKKEGDIATLSALFFLL